MSELQSVAEFRASLGLPVAGSAKDKSTLIKLVISGQQPIWGINKGTAGVSADALNKLNEDAKCCNPKGTGLSPYALTHAEADSIFQAYQKMIMASTAVMYCDRPLCDNCMKTVANILCLIGTVTLTWIGPNEARTGYVSYKFTAP